jgi:hypothetical protein
VASDLFLISLSAATAGSGVSNKCGKDQFRCSNPFGLTCMGHGEEIFVRCGRRTCPGCARWKGWKLKQRFMAGIENVPAGKWAVFFTLTFPLYRAPSEEAAHRAWRSLVGRLRYRRYLGAYGWTLERQKNGTLHFHGIVHLPWFADGLAEWRELLGKSGFGPRNRIEIAGRDSAAYCAKYISKGAVELAPLRRAYGFSENFPRARALVEREILAEQFGVTIDSDCEWTPSYQLRE